MVIIRNVFKLKFGKAREAVALVKEGLDIQKRIAQKAGVDFRSRVLTDVTGPFYTLVLELAVPSIGTFEQHAATFMGNPEWQARSEERRVGKEGESRVGQRQARRT